MSIQIDEFSLAVSEILDGYAEDIQEAVAQAVEETGTKALKTVKAKSPVRKGKGGGRYKKGWRIKKERSGVLGTQAQVTVYNKTDGPLVHLLKTATKRPAAAGWRGSPTSGPPMRRQSACSRS